MFMSDRSDRITGWLNTDSIRILSKDSITIYSVRQ